MKLSFFTDEVTQDLGTAIQFAKVQGLAGVELRSVENTPIDRVLPETLKRWKQMLEDAGLTVCSLASSFFKCEIQEAGGELEKLKRLCDAADILDCPFIRGFCFFREGDACVTQELLSQFAPVRQLLEQRNKVLLLEADPSVNTTNHAALAEVLAALDSPVFGAIYDPGNDIYDPEGEIPYPDGYRAVKPWLRHIHIKDALRNADGEPECVCIGTGWVDYPGLLRALQADGYDGWMSLETHYRKNAAISEAMMTRPGGEDFSRGGMEATAESAQALKKLIMEAHLCT